MLALAATVAVLALIAALLAVPVVLDVRAERIEALKTRWRLRWLFGLVDFRSPEPRPAPEAVPPAQKPARRRGRGARMGVAVLRTRGLLRRVERLGLALSRHVTVQEFRLDTAFGFDNPADTGVVYGLLSPLVAHASLRGRDVGCRPLFLESGLRGVCSASVSVRPLALAGALVAFFLSPPVVRAAVSAWRTRR